MSKLENIKVPSGRGQGATFPGGCRLVARGGGEVSLLGQPWSLLSGGGLVVRGAMQPSSGLRLNSPLEPQTCLLPADLLCISSSPCTSSSPRPPPWPGQPPPPALAREADWVSE